MPNGNRQAFFSPCFKPVPSNRFCRRARGLSIPGRFSEKIGCALGDANYRVGLAVGANGRTIAANSFSQ